jgi:hypothetical protein
MRFKSLFLGAVVCAVLTAMTGTAFADPSGTVKEPKVKAETLTSVESETASFEGDTDNTGSGGGTTVLPFTGADITLFLVIGLAAIGAGAALVRRAGS